jgi:hypothetical protein
MTRGNFPNPLLRPSAASVSIPSARHDAEVRPSRLGPPHSPLTVEPPLEGTPRRAASLLPRCHSLQHAAAAPACDARMPSAPRQAPAQRHRFTPLLATTRVRRLGRLAFLLARVDPPRLCLGALLVRRVASVPGHLAPPPPLGQRRADKASALCDLHARPLPASLVAPSCCCRASLRPASACARSARRALSTTRPSHPRSLAAPI